MDVTLLRVVTSMPPTVVDGGPVVIDDIEGLRGEAEDNVVPLAAERLAKDVRGTTPVRCGQPVEEILAGDREVG